MKFCPVKIFHYTVICYIPQTTASGTNMKTIEGVFRGDARVSTSIKQQLHDHQVALVTGKMEGSTSIQVLQT